MRGWRYVSTMIDMLLPRTCVVCGRKLNTYEKHLCLHCVSDLPLTRFAQMSHNPMADKFNEAIQKGLDDSWRQEAYAFASALFFYEDESEYRHIPHQIKYQGNIPAGQHFGRMLGRELLTAEWISDVDMIIPVPLHWKRRWSRGYNQAEIIAQGVSAKLGIPMRTDILGRIRKTKTQTVLDVLEKSANVSGAFKVLTSVTGLKHILLIDDVFTTGSTLHACFVALREVYPYPVRISVATLGFVQG